ncbi:MAG: preprotein translocase subunit SecG [Bdellovibrionaceae bacterium]|nr:preprotein translocase subunit SecG [Bdellovibrio sp.]
MITFLAVIHIIACLGLVGLVLIQDSKGGGVFNSQASSNSVLGAGGGASLAQTMTKVVAGLFAATCIALSIISARTERSVIDTTQTQIPQIPNQVPAGTPIPPATTDAASANPTPAANAPAPAPGTPNVPPANK